jgi:heme A synthase
VTTSAKKKSYSFSWFIVAYTVLVIIWGAWVRLSGSGDGCGDDWPRCNGAVVPTGAPVKTLIEYSHRLSTALYGLLVVAQILITRKLFVASHSARFWSWMTLLFTITEALIGRELVKAGLVNQSTDVSRLIVMPLHLLNTALLLLSTVMTAESIKYGDRARARLPSASVSRGLFIVSCLILILTSGAIAALGSHLDPSTSLVSGFSKDLSGDSHLAVRLRMLHPLLALTTAGTFLVFSLSGIFKNIRLHSRWVSLFGYTFATAVGVGILTLGLLSPLWLKLSHLLMANVLVIVSSLCVFHALRPESSENPQ